jgi:tetratricopeptide (TPR) repeat protein
MINPYDEAKLATKDDDAGLRKVLDEHPEVKLLLERREKLPVPLEINGIDPLVHVYLEATVENQLSDPDLPEVREALARLERAGLNRHVARANIARLLAVQMYEMLKFKRPFDAERYLRELRLLGTDLSKVGRNHPCPCGSGVKFKRCCLPKADLFKIDTGAGYLCLGQGAYIFGSPEWIADHPQDSILVLENRTHIAHYLEEHGDVAGAKRALEENVILSERYRNGSFLKNALDHFQLFCLNHAEWAEEGMAVTERLMSLAKSEEEKGLYWCDKADLLLKMGKVEEAERVFRDVFTEMPHWHFGRYRYALWLMDADRKEEAVAILRELVASKDHIDDETYTAARDVLKDLER